MATVKQLLDIARAELGTQESPTGSNRVKYSAWYGLVGPWCVMFVEWACAQAGVVLPVRTASCTALMNAAKSAKMWVTGAYQPGDIVIYDWGGDRVPDHCGIVESASGTQVVAIEGNTSVGNDSNGGEVMRRTRRQTQVLGAVRPLFQKEVNMDNIPAEAHKEGVAWAMANGILQGGADGDLLLAQPVTRQQLCTMLYRLSKLLEKK